jgi:transcriptional regulator with XRE-family HTH domain
VADPHELLHARYGAQFGPRVTALRESAGISVAELSEATGLGRRSVYKLEDGEIDNPKLGLLLSLRAALKLRSVEELLGELPEFPSVSYSPNEDAN